MAATARRVRGLILGSDPSADVRVLAVAVIAGVGWVYSQPVLTSPLWLLCAALPAVLRFPGRSAWLALVLAALWATHDAATRLDRRLPEADNASVAEVTGRVVGLPEHDAIRSRFVVATTGATPRRLRLSWYDDAPSLAPGDCLTLRAKRFTPHGSLDPGAFDYEAWLWRERIDATGYVKRGHRCAQDAAAPLGRLRAAALARVDALLASSPMRGIVEALTLGYRQAITDAQWRVLRATGTSHLVAISGLHIGLIAVWLFALARWLALRTNAGARLPVNALAGGVALAGALGYALLAGMALPTQRALTMVVLGLVAFAAMREVSPARVLASAALLVVLWQPDAVIAPGFWLSFGAVAWLIYLARDAPRSKLGWLVRMQLGLVAGLMPLTLWFFEQASLIAPLVNAVLIPAAALLVPLVLLTTLLALVLPVLGAPLLGWVAQLLAFGWQGLGVLAGLPSAAVHVALPGVGALVLALAGLAILFMPRGLPARGVGAILLLPALLGWQPAGQALAPGAFELDVLDVGQGLANVVLTRDHTLVFDAGPRYRTGYDAGEAIVVPYLRHRRRDTVDLMMISHGDIDHIGGAAAIERALTVRRRSGAGSAHPCRAGQHWRWDGVRFAVLYPSRAERREARARNERSCVLRVASAQGSALLTGDMDAAAERRLLARRRRNLRADVLVVAHHGSATSSTAPFLAAVSPRWALVSAGWHNRWDFPRPAVVARLQAAGARLANTATAGAIRVDVGGSDIEVRRWRRVHRRFWQTPRTDAR